jgi:hypothetical protein
MDGELQTSTSTTAGQFSFFFSFTALTVGGLRAIKEFRRGSGQGWPRLDRIYFSLFVLQQRIADNVQQKGQTEDNCKVLSIALTAIVTDKAEISKSVKPIPACALCMLY